MKYTKLTKQGTQRLLKDMRRLGLKIDRKSNGYEIQANGTVVFKAMVGRFDYFIAYDPSFVERRLKGYGLPVS